MASHNMPEAENFAGIAAWLLGRPPNAEDGVPEAELAAAEQRLGHALPPALREFYRTVGRQPAITQSFERFAGPDKWTVSEDKIVFLEENQGVCYWAADDRSKVYQTADLDDPEWHEEEEGLAEFLRVLLYYQMAQGGYPFCGMIPADEFSSPGAVLEFAAAKGGQQVVDFGRLENFPCRPAGALVVPARGRRSRSGALPFNAHRGDIPAPVRGVGVRRFGVIGRRGAAPPGAISGG